MKIGDILREAREARGLDLDEVAGETKIRPRYLEALEEERYDLLPEDVYIKGFVRIYANYLGLNAEPLVAFFDQQRKEERQREEQERNERQREEDRPDPKERRLFVSRKKKLFYVLITLLACVLAFELYVHLRNTFPQQVQLKTKISSEIKKQNGSGQNSEQINQPDDSTVSPAPVNKHPSILKQHGLDLVLSVVQESCWMNVVVDGETKFTGELTANQSLSFQGKNSIKVKLGNAGVTRVRINGRDLGFLGNNKDVVTKEFLATGEW